MSEQIIDIQSWLPNVVRSWQPRFPLEVDDIVGSTVEKMLAITQQRPDLEFNRSYIVRTAENVMWSELRRNTAPALPGAGWYRDPYGAGERFFDGRRWSSRVRAAAGMAEYQNVLEGDLRGRRRPRLKATVPEEGWEPAADPSVEPEAAVLANDTVARLLSTLPSVQRKAVWLHIECGTPHVDIARTLGVPEGTVRRWYSTFCAASRVAHSIGGDAES